MFLFCIENEWFYVPIRYNWAVDVLIHIQAPSIANRSKKIIEKLLQPIVQSSCKIPIFTCAVEVYGISMGEWEHILKWLEILREQKNTAHLNIGFILPDIDNYWYHRRIVLHKCIHWMYRISFVATMVLRIHHEDQAPADNRSTF